MITQERLGYLLNYNPGTGEFTWLNPNKNTRYQRGDSFGGLDAGYLRGKLDGKSYFLQRLAILYMTGSFPDGEVDHINGIKTDNRWVNLRTCSKAENQRNQGARKTNSLGVKGMTLVDDGLNPRFKGNITIPGGKKLTISRTFERGNFLSQAKACFEVETWLRETRAEHHGEFSRDS